MTGLIIYQPWGGLGDNLAHSIIPELCRERGIKCYLSKHNAYRNQDIHDFVWGINPYIEKEYTDTTDLSWLDKCKTYEVGGLNHIQVLQRVYGFNTDIEYPKIYYNPKYICSFQNKTLIDLTACTTAGDMTIDKIQNILNNLYINTNNTVYVTHSSIPHTKAFYLQNEAEVVDINNLKYYSDVISSSTRFITLFSGQSVLASTLKHQLNLDIQIDVLAPSRYLPHPNYSYTFSNTNYIPIY